MSGRVVLNIQSRPELWKENMEIFVFFKNGEDSKDFSRENRTKKAV